MWLTLYFVTSATVFALTLGGIVIVQGPASSQVAPTFDVAGAVGIVSYGAFHWLLLALVTSPIVAAPVVVWIVLERRPRFQQMGVLEMLLLSGGLGSAVLLVQLISLEYPTLKATPSALLSSYTVASWMAFVLGLFVARLLIGTFSSAVPKKGHPLDALKDARK